VLLIAAMAFFRFPEKGIRFQKAKLSIAALYEEEARVEQLRNGLG
jgi:hypothetical protein